MREFEEKTNAVVPTRVGVNRRSCWPMLTANRRPHACGGEPILASVLVRSVAVVPTRVGVNRCAREAPDDARRRPHACGGEPIMPPDFQEVRMSSPRVWG